MPNQPTQKPRITGYGNGPHIYGAELVGTFFDGAALTITVGNLEPRQDRLDDHSTGVPDLAISGRLTLTPEAAAKVMQAINNLLNAVATGNAQKPRSGAN